MRKSPRMTTPEGCNFFAAVLVFFVYLVVFAIGQNNRHLCELCDCSPSQTEAAHVDCNCKKNKVLLLKEEHEEVLVGTQTLNISSCSFLSFPQGGFQKSKKLKTVHIRDMKLLHLNAGVFPAVTNLAIENVDELIVNFQGSNALREIRIEKSFLAELPEEALITAKLLEKILFREVSIGVIASSAIRLTSNSKPYIQFVNCKINEISSEGVSGRLSRLEIVNTTLNTLHLNALNVTVAESADILDCKFGPLLYHDAFSIKANAVDIRGNEFASLPASFLYSVHTHRPIKVNFVENVLHDIDLGGFLLHSEVDKLNFARNRIVCDCSPRKTSILKLNQLFPGLLPNGSLFDSIAENNYCQNYEGISMAEFKRQLLNKNVCNGTEDQQATETETTAGTSIFTETTAGTSATTQKINPEEIKSSASRIFASCTIILSAFVIYLNFI